MSKVFDLIDEEKHRQDENVELIASENFVSNDILKAMGSILTNKYAEGYPAIETRSGNIGRYYGGCQIVDKIEQYCCDTWQKVFNTNYHVNVQPHSGSQANFAAYAAIIKPGDTILSMSLDNGGHLTHGSKVSFSGKLYNIISYDVNNDGIIDYDDIKEKLIKTRPALLVAGASAYSRFIDFKKIKELIDANSPDTKFMVDMAHIAGLIAAGVHPSPFGLADIITTTTHKTLRGPRGGLIFCKPEYAKKVDSAVFPYSQGGPLLHIIAAKAVCAEEALTDNYKTYIKNVVSNCNVMCEEFKKLGYHIITNGSDNHLFLLDLTHLNISGKQAQEALDAHHITVNKNCIPCEKRSPKETSGIRIGTAAMTTKGWTNKEFIDCAHKIDEILKKCEGLA